MNCYIKQGYLHHLSPSTVTLAPGPFDTIRLGVGAKLEKQIVKILDKHDRRPGVFKPNSEIKPLIDQYVAGAIELCNLSDEIAEKVFESKQIEGISERRALFILEGESNGGSAIWIIETERKYDNAMSANSNEVDEVELFPDTRGKNVKFAEILLKDMSVNVLEGLVDTEDGAIYLYADVILKIDMDYSLKYYVYRAREVFDSIVIGNAKDYSENKEVIEKLNTFETSIADQLWLKKEIEFMEIANNIFFTDITRREKFKDALKDYGVNEVIVALSDKPLEKRSFEHKPKRIYLSQGAKIVVPDTVKELEFKIKEIDGELQIVD